MAESAIRLARRSVLGLVVVIAFGQAVRPAFTAEPGIKVHRDPSCGCCSKWVRHLREAGFAVEVDDTADLSAVRSQFGIPSELVACHTAELGDYLLEGHVPAPAIRRLLAERPKARGLAVPGMPVGAPGMEGRQPQPNAVVLFGADGHAPFMRFVGPQVIG
jgi:hypothetical protein